MARFVPNPAGILEMARGQLMIEACLGLAQPLTEHVRELSPELTGHEKKSIIAVPSREIVTKLGIIGGARVTAFSKLAHLIEFGTGQRETKEGGGRGEMPAFAPFRRAAEATGAYVPSGRAH